MADDGAAIAPEEPANGGGGGPLLPRNHPHHVENRQFLRWSRVEVNPSSVIPPPRSGAASVVVKDRLWLFGGYGGGTGRLDDFYCFEFATGMWKEVQVLSDEKPGCRENNGVVISDSSKEIFLFGGYNGSHWLNDLWKFDIVEKRWTCIQESSDPNNPNGEEDEADNAAEAAAAAAMDDSGGLMDICGRQPVRGKIPSPRFGYVSVVHKGKFILSGGFDGQKWMNDMHVFDFKSKCWTEVQPKGQIPSARSCPAWAKDGTHVWIHGGYDGVDRKADFWSLDLDTYTWTELPCLGTPPSPRYFHSCCLYHHKLYVYGGYSGQSRLSDMFAYDFETNHWSQVDCTNGDAPSGRSSLVAQVHNNNLYVFGGYDGTKVLYDFYKFKLRAIGVPPPSLVSDFRRLINNSDLADVCFLVEGKEVYAHRAVLAIRSEYFRVMLCGGMRETSRASADAPIELPDVSHTVFLKVLEFLYTDTASDVSLETGIHLLIASELFMLDRLKALCEDLIRRDIDVNNVISILVASHRHNASGLRDIALEFILRNLNEPAVMTGLAELKVEPDLLLEIIKRSSSRSNSGGSEGGGSGGASPALPPTGPFA